MKTKRRNLRPWLESRLRRLKYKLDHQSIAFEERIRCEMRELELKRALWTGWQGNAPSMPRSYFAKIAERFAANFKP